MTLRKELVATLPARPVPPALAWKASGSLWLTILLRVFKRVAPLLPPFKHPSTRLSVYSSAVCQQRHVLCTLTPYHCTMLPRDIVGTHTVQHNHNELAFLSPHHCTTHLGVNIPLCVRTWLVKTYWFSSSASKFSMSASFCRQAAMRS